MKHHDAGEMTRQQDDPSSQEQMIDQNTKHLIVCEKAHAWARSSSQEDTIDRALRVFKDAGFGLFIHFGLYSLLGGEYEGKETPFLAEWIRLSLNIPGEDYRHLAASFNPRAFDADRICELARSWGMKYVCLIATKTGARRRTSSAS